MLFIQFRTNLQILFLPPFQINLSPNHTFSDTVEFFPVSDQFFLLVVEILLELMGGVLRVEELLCVDYVHFPHLEHGVTVAADFAFVFGATFEFSQFETAFVAGFVTTELTKILHSFFEWFLA